MFCQQSPYNFLWQQYRTEYLVLVQNLWVKLIGLHPEGRAWESREHCGKEEEWKRDLVVRGESL